MSAWRITGADRRTGADRTITVDAHNATEAEEIASLQCGLYIEKCEEIKTISVAYETPDRATINAMELSAAPINGGNFLAAVRRGLRGMRSGYRAARARQVAAKQNRESFRQAASLAAAPKCQLCSAPLWATTSGSIAFGLAIAALIFCAGIAVFILIPCFGWVLGPIICVCALFMGGKRQKVWECSQCHTTWPRL